MTNLCSKLEETAPYTNLGVQETDPISIAFFTLLAYENRATNSRLPVNNRRNLVSPESSIVWDRVRQVLPLLGITEWNLANVDYHSPEECVEQGIDPKNYTQDIIEIMFSRKRQGLVNVDLCFGELPGTCEEFANQMQQIMLTQGVPFFLKGDPIAKDALFYDRTTGVHYAVQVRTDCLEPGQVAKGLVKTVVEIFDSKGLRHGNGLVAKDNPSHKISDGEYSKLKGIASCTELTELKIKTPRVYGINGNRIVMENLPYQTVQQYLGKEKDPKRREDILMRMVKGTEIIERNMRDWLAGIDDGSDLTGGEKVAELGGEYAKAVAYLRQKGMFDRLLSDSKQVNWLYDEKEDTLYKIDENIRLKGSKYSCIARILGTNLNDVEPLVTKFSPDSLEDMYLSLFVTSLERPLTFAGKDHSGFYRQMIDCAKYYLDRLVEISNKWQTLKEKFEIDYVAAPVPIAA